MDQTYYMLSALQLGLVPKGWCLGEDRHPTAPSGAPRTNPLATTSNFLRLHLEGLANLSYYLEKLTKEYIEYKTMFSPLPGQG